MRCTMIRWIAGGTLLACAATGAAAAPASEQNDALEMKGAMISLEQAIRAAQRRTGGKAAKAEYERSAGHSVIDVETVLGRQVRDVKVDPATGEIVSVDDDAVDQDDAADRAD